MGMPPAIYRTSNTIIDVSVCLRLSACSVCDGQCLGRSLKPRSDCGHPYYGPHLIFPGASLHRCTDRRIYLGLHIACKLVEKPKPQTLTANTALRTRSKLTWWLQVALLTGPCFSPFQHCMREPCFSRPHSPLLSFTCAQPPVGGMPSNAP